jgi:hypothetical protein
MADLRRIVPAAGEGEPRMVLVATDAVPAKVRRIEVPLKEYEGGRGRGSAGDPALSKERIALMAAALKKALGAPPRRREAELAAEARARLVKQPPPGARWASSWGCGVNVEGSEPDMVKCGMGHVPEASRRFLYFYAMTPAEQRKAGR